MKTLLKIIETLGLILLLSTFSSQSFSVQHDIYDPDMTIADDIETTKQAVAIDHFMTWYHTQGERHNKAVELCQKKNMSDIINDQSITITIGNCDDFLRNLLIQLRYLSTGFTTANLKLFGRHKGLERTLYIKDLQMRILGTIYSILNPDGGGDLDNQSYPSDTSSLAINLQKETAKDILNSLLSMPETMKDHLYVYSYVEDNPIQDQDPSTVAQRRVYTVPILWTLIVSALDSYRLITQEDLNTGSLNQTMVNMQAAHAQARYGIEIYQAMDGAPAIQNSGYGIVLDAIQYGDMHLSESQINFKNPTSARKMSFVAAEIARDLARLFLTNNDIPWSNIDESAKQTAERKLNATANEIHAKRAIDMIGN